MTFLCVVILAATACLPSSLAIAAINPPDEINPTPTPAPVYRLLQKNDSNNEVKDLKERMQDLGYFKRSSQLSKKFNDSMTEALTELLTVNELPLQTDVTPELQAFIFSDRCKPKTLDFVTPTPMPTALPFVYPQDLPDYPALTGQGFLADGAVDGDEYVLVDEEKGLWRYITKSLFIEIKRYSDPNKPLVWFETEILTGEGESLRSLRTATKRTKRRAVTIARTNQAVLAFSDDYYEAHDYGVAIRDGEVLSSRLIHPSTKRFPLSDTLAVFPDGSMRADERRAFTAEEFIAMGAVHVLNFGPVLVHEGKLGERVATNDYSYHNEPRNALGMVEPNHYVLITVNGRVNNSKGTTLQWLARRMQAMGAKEALNLDGGFTTSLIFMGWQINKVSNVKASGKNGRSMTSLLSFGSSPIVPSQDEDEFD